MRCRAAALLTTATLVGLAPGTARADEPEEPTAGAPGIGDPYFPLDGNGGYDVGHYELDLRYDPATDELSGTAVVSGRATQHLSSFNLDFSGLEITALAVNGHEASWTRDGGELTVTPAEPLEEGAKFAVRVAYSGVPETVEDALGISGFIHTDDGAVVAGQPDVAATWYPANDHPRDAASVDVDITVPEGLEAISNGELEQQVTDDGWTTWEWEADEPMAPYLVVLAIGEFDVREYREGGLHYWDALDPDLFTMPTGEDGSGPTVGENAEAALGRQPEIIDFLEGLYGPYPFDQAGGIVDDFPDLQFALETQTRSIYSQLFFTDTFFGEIVVVHELAHQWLGDAVRLEQWQDIWLNEGAATYAEWLWQEAEGQVTAQQQFDDLLNLAPDPTIPEDEDFYYFLWSVAPGDPGPDDLFHPAVYIRGAMTHHALRVEIGDEDYFRFLRTWATSQSGDTATTEEFIALAEEMSGQQLDELFDTWVFTPGRPDSLPAPAPVPVP